VIISVGGAAECASPVADFVDWNRIPVAHPASAITRMAVPPRTDVVAKKDVMIVAYQKWCEYLWLTGQGKASIMLGFAANQTAASGAAGWELGGAGCFSALLRAA
jgi:hypothetical protein